MSSSSSSSTSNNWASGFRPTPSTVPPAPLSTNTPTTWAADLRPARSEVSPEPPLSVWALVFSQMNMKLGVKRAELDAKLFEYSTRRGKLEEALATSRLPVEIDVEMTKLFPYPPFPIVTSQADRERRKRYITRQRVEVGTNVLKRHIALARIDEKDCQMKLDDLQNWIKNEGVSMAELHIPNPSQSQQDEFRKLWTLYFSIPPLTPQEEEKDLDRFWTLYFSNDQPSPQVRQEDLDQFRLMTSTRTFGEIDANVELLL